MHALVIEDHSLTAWLIGEELRELGFDSVEVATTEDSACEAAARRKPDLITSDGEIEQGSGLGAVARIWASLDAATPVLFVTGDAERARDFAPGAIVIEKPFSAHQFGRAVRQVVHG